MASSAFSVAVDSLNTSRNCLCFQLPRALHIFHGDLQREQRIAQLMRQAPRQFAPGGYALGLHQAFFLLRERLRHIVESRSPVARFHRVPRTSDARVPAPCGDFTRAFGQLFNRPGDARRNPQADQQSHQQSPPATTAPQFQNVRALAEPIRRANCPPTARRAILCCARSSGSGMESFGGRGIRGPLNGLHHRLRLFWICSMIGANRSG